MSRHYYTTPQSPQGQFDLMRAIRTEQDQAAKARQAAYTQVADEHPDFSDAQINMVLDGSLKAAPSNQTGYSPQFSVGSNGRASSFKVAPSNQADILARQENKFRLGQIERAQSQLDKLDPSDEDNSTKIDELKNRIDDLNSQASEKPSEVQPQAAVPLGKGTAGEVAPIYQAGGPAAFKRLSNGGSVYFGPASGAPEFTNQRPQAIQDQPAAGTVPPAAVSATAPAAPVVQPPSRFKIAGDALASVYPFGTSFNPGRAVSDAKELYNSFTQPDAPPAPPAFTISPSQIKKRVAIAKQLTQLGPDAPAEYTDAVNQKLAEFDSSVTNPVAKPYRITGAPQGAVDNALAALPDSGTPVPATPQGIPVRNKTTGKTGIQMPDGTIVPDDQ